MEMTDPRTIRRILQKLEQGETPETRIKGYRYYVEYNKEFDEILVIPMGSGDPASSGLKYDQYEYTHGGKIFQEAVDLAKTLDEARRMKIQGEPKSINTITTVRVPSNDTGNEGGR